MSLEPPELSAARALSAEVGAALGASPSFQRLPAGTREAVLRDLGTIQGALRNPADPYALALETPLEMARRRAAAGGGRPSAPADGNGSQPAATTAPARPPATETIAARAGALSDEIDFPAFVAGLVHGTFGAIVDATIRQMEEFANLVSALARSVDDFTRENVTSNQARDWLVEQHPGDLGLDVPAAAAQGAPRLRSRRPEDDEPPAWLADYGLAGEPLTDELVEEQLVPAARTRLGESRMQTLATMVLLGMNRVNVRDGRIAARVRFRAQASDRTAVDFATSQDPGGGGWGTRGSATYANHTTLISTVGVNAQADADLKAELFGEVEINFVSETLPLDRFADAASLSLLQRNARWTGAAVAGAPGQAAPPVAAAPAPSAPATAPPATTTPAPPAGGTG